MSQWLCQLLAALLHDRCVPPTHRPFPLQAPFAEEIMLLSLTASAKGNEAFHQAIVMAMLVNGLASHTGGSTAC
jgi:hypothetical protein